MDYLEQRKAILNSIGLSVSSFIQCADSYAMATGMLESVLADAIMEMPECQRESFLNSFRMNVEKCAEQLGKR